MGMLFYFEDEIDDMINQMQFLLDNEKELKKEDKEHIKGMAIQFMIDLHKYLKENDYDAYEKMIDYAAECNEKNKR